MAGYSDGRRLKIVRWFGQPVLWCRSGLTPSPLGEGWGEGFRATCNYNVVAGFSPQKSAVLWCGLRFNCFSFGRWFGVRASCRLVIMRRFSPSSRRATRSILRPLLMLSGESWADCGLKPAANLRLQIRLRPSPRPSPKGEGVKTGTLPAILRTSFPYPWCSCWYAATASSAPSCIRSGRT